MSLPEVPFEFTRMDQMGLTACSTSKELCPAPMTCLRRNRERAKPPAMSFRTVGAEDNECLYYVQHESIRDEARVFKGHRRHNKHVFA